VIEGIRVLDRSTGIAGPYCTKVLVDAGADVVKSEPPGGDPMRTWRSGGLFEYLNGGKRSVTAGAATAGEAGRATPGDAALVRGADVIVSNDPADAALIDEHPGLVVVTITPFGVDGPWAGRPATELTLQAACGSLGGRGLPERPPLPAGGRIGEWITGSYAAVATLAAIGLGPDRPGRHVDVAMLDCMAVSLVTYPSVFASFSGWPAVEGTPRVIEVPSIEPTRDGYVVFTTNSGQQFHDFLVLIGRPDLQADEGLARATERFARRAEFLDLVHRYTRGRTSAEALEEAGLLRIPAGPVLNGSTVCDFEQFRARGVFEPAPSGRFRQPRRPYRIGGAAPVPPRPAPGLGADDATVDWPARSSRPEPGLQPVELPLSGLRVLDCTAWWAGPAAAQVLAYLGADVVKVESVKRPDLMRMSSTKRPGVERWWEWGPLFHGANAGKRAVTLDLGDPRGVDLFCRLARSADVVIENYTPRVMDHFGLGWDRLHEINPSLVFVRMPAFGLDGPWRDRTGFAQTMESISGMAWVTGFPDGPPVLPRGPCDPVAGLHAVMATILALRAARAGAPGQLVEATMVEAALNVAAEQVIEWDASGTVLGREGARGLVGAPQGVYPCAGTDRWIAMSVRTDAEWAALCRRAGIDAEPGWASAAGRRGDHDRLDAILAGWTAGYDADQLAEELQALGIPAAAVINGRDLVHNPQLRHRQLFETEDHPVTGRHEIPAMPVRFSDVKAWMTRPSPVLGQHNDEILGEVASPEELEELRRSGLIGERLAAG
jgi:crotonobetainyl-CoA:carnitine CoA-transferase CaiB-like acyl-CoA transferase